MSRLRKMDAQVSRKATIVALVLGIVGVLVMGSGMSILMTDLGAILGMTGIAETIIGIMIGLIGMLLAAIAYPAFNRVLKKEREKIAPEILRLTEELMK